MRQFNFFLQYFVQYFKSSLCDLTYRFLWGHKRAEFGQATYLQ